MIVSDGNDVGRNVGRYIIILGFNDGKGSYGIIIVFVVYFGSMFEEMRVEVENVIGVGFMFGGMMEKKGYLMVSNGLFG